MQIGGFPEWRGRLAAAWLIGLGRKTQFRDSIGELLLESRVCFSGRGYCVALACFDTRRDAEILIGYLDHYLPQADLRYDQHWALGALMRLDAGLGTRHPDLDLALPGNAAGLDDDAHDIAAQASAAWEAAVCWGDDYALQRLAEVRAV